MATRTIELATRDSHEFAPFIRIVRRGRLLGAWLYTLGGDRRHLVFASIEIRVDNLRPAFFHFTPLLPPIARHFSTRALCSVQCLPLALSRLGSTALLSPIARRFHARRPPCSSIARHFPARHPPCFCSSPAMVRPSHGVCPLLTALLSPIARRFHARRPPCSPPSPGTFPPVTRRAFAHHPQWFARRTAFVRF